MNLTLTIKDKQITIEHLHESKEEAEIIAKFEQLQNYLIIDLKSGGKNLAIITNWLTENGVSYHEIQPILVVISEEVFKLSLLLRLQCF